MTLGIAGDARESRLAKLRAKLAAADLRSLLVTSRANIRYLTGFSGSNGLVVVSEATVVLITDFRYQTQAREESGAVVEVEIEANSLWTRLWTVLARLTQLEPVGFESQHLVHLDHQRIVDSGSRWQWRPTSDLVEGMRQQKDPTEVAHIRAAVAIAEEALAQTVQVISAGMSEFAVAAQLEMRLRALGSEAHPFETIVASGERSALPHARCSARELRAGDLLIVDFGAVSGGYCSDITRTFVVGAATAGQREAYQVVQDANAAASAGVVAGMRGREADALARDLIERRGLASEFGHSLGHGIGLEVHEGPRLAKSADLPLPAGCVVTIEPGVYREGWGGIRIEDDVYVGRDGPVVLTSYRRDLQELT